MQCKYVTGQIYFCVIFFSTKVMITYHLIGYFMTYREKNLGFNVEDSLSQLCQYLISYL